ncbi:MAG: flagellar motor protein MotB [Candidatus Latescibacteria bacterium]|nr:flagellar motor protein MotB [Candidatus Latescibacterota bacterium]
MASEKKKGFVGFRKKSGDEGEGWLTTYGDLVTLLLTFFVLLVAMAKFDVQKFQSMAQSMAKAMGGGKKEATLIPLKEIEQEVKQIIKEEGLQGEVSAYTRSDGVAIEAKGGVSFETGKAELKSEFKQFMLKILPEIIGTSYNIAVEGHTDNVPIGGIYPSNWELSTARASSVVRFFIDQGIPANRFRATGFADTLPKRPNVAPDGTSIPENQALNRRVVIVFLAVGRPEAERKAGK